MANLRKNQELGFALSQLSILIQDGHFVVRHEEVDKVVEVGKKLGFVVHGGSFIGDEYQCLYID